MGCVIVAAVVVDGDAAVEDEEVVDVSEAV